MTNQQIVDAALSVASIVRCADCVYFAEWDKPSARLKAIEANSLAAIQAVMDSQKELRQKLKEMGF